MSENTTTPEVTTPGAPTPPELQSGFAILIDVDGNVYVERDTQALAIKVNRETSLIEVRRYLSEILMDLQAQAAAEYTFVKLSKENK